MGGRVILDIVGTSLTDAEADLLKRPAVAGVIFFQRNFESVSQIQSLVNQIRAVREDLILSVDQEGGRVQRFKEGVTRLPPVAVLRQTYAQFPEQGLADAEQLGWLMAAEMLALGVDLSYAPVLDIDYGNNQVIGDRAFGVTAQDVTALAQAYIRGMHRAGMAVVGKHFPGHGYVDLDSHETLPHDRRPLSALEADMRPFAELMPNLEAIMSAHIVYEAQDALPASFSEYWLGQQLRGRLGYQGLIMSDALDMKGAWQQGAPSERGIKAINAGCDLLLYCNDPEGANELVSGLESAGIDLHVDTSILRRAPAPEWATFEASDARRSALDVLKVYLQEVEQG